MFAEINGDDQRREKRAGRHRRQRFVKDANRRDARFRLVVGDERGTDDDDERLAGNVLA